MRRGCLRYWVNYAFEKITANTPFSLVQACGHRYVKIIRGGNEEQRRMIGRCYVRSNDLTFDNNDDWQSYRYEVCNPTFDTELEGMCNMGISGGMTDTDVYLGAPGSYVWQGGAPRS